MNDFLDPEKPAEALAVGEPAALPAASGAAWVRDAWHLFKAHWLEFLVAFVLMFAARFVLGLASLPGEVIGALLMPILAAGYMAMAHSADGGGEAAIASLFDGFRQERRDRLVRLLQLGLLSIAFSLVMALLVGSVFFQQVGGMAVLEDPQLLAKSLEAILMDPGVGLAIWAVGLMVLATLYGCAVYFAVPLLWFSDVRLLQALHLSLSACKRNVLPLLVFFLVVILLMLLAIFTFGLGFLVLFPLLMLSNYTSFRHIFTNGPQQPSSLV